MTILRVIDHARSPGGRYIGDGTFSGEWFREEILSPALRKAIADGDRLVVELDDTAGYGASFLDEAFGGLIRTGAFTHEDIARHLSIEARTRLFAPYKQLSDRYIRDAWHPLKAA